MCFFRLGGSLFCPIIPEQLYEFGVTVSGRQQKLAEQAENFSAKSSSVACSGTKLGTLPDGKLTVLLQRSVVKPQPVLQSPTEGGIFDRFVPCFIDV